MNMCTKFEVNNFTNSKDGTRNENLKTGHVTLTTPALRVIVIHACYVIPKCHMSSV